MAIKKYKPLSPDPYVGKTKGDTEMARLAHLNNLVDQVNTELSVDRRPYKVYTALLTQSGADNPQTLTSGAVTKGVTYYTDGLHPASDFTNVGGPIGTGLPGFFVAINNDVPNSYAGTSLNYNTGAPVVTVLENTIGNIYWTYNDVGSYFGNLASGFPANKTYYSVTSRFSDDGGASAYDAFLSRGTDNVSYLSTWNNGLLSNSLIMPNFPLSIEIRVYN